MKENENILYSIIIPTYNRTKLIGNAIQSIINQIYNNWELIIVDDGSTDNTEEVIKEFNDNRIRYFKKEHEERSIARNFGIDKASGLYVSFLDDDDYYLPEFLDEFNKRIENENRPIGVFISEEVLKSGKKFLKKRFNIKQIQYPIRMIWNYEPGIRPVIIHKDLFTVNKFPLEFNIGEDMHLIIRILMENNLFLLTKPLYVFCQHQDQGVSMKFKHNIQYNAMNSLNCINDLISKNEKIFNFIPKNEVYDKVNHIVYGFSSAAMKNGDIQLFYKLVRKFDTRGNNFKLLYQILSLILRLPYYFLNNILNK